MAHGPLSECWPCGQKLGKCWPDRAISSTCDSRVHMSVVRSRRLRSCWRCKKSWRFWRDILTWRGFVGVSTARFGFAATQPQVSDSVRAEDMTWWICNKTGQQCWSRCPKLACRRAQATPARERSCVDPRAASAVMVGSSVAPPLRFPAGARRLFCICTRWLCVRAVRGLVFAAGTDLSRA